jgi:hypothetical protein
VKAVSESCGMTLRTPRGRITLAKGLWRQYVSNRFNSASAELQIASENKRAEWERKRRGDDCVLVEWSEDHSTA